MFAADISCWLNANMTNAGNTHVAEHRAEIQEWLDDLGIAPGTELSYFYLHYDAFAVRGGYQLNELEQIQDATDYAHAELCVPVEYIALTGTEGQGIVLYNRVSEAVYDVEFGKFEALAEGLLTPVASSFQDFLRWCKNQATAPG